MRYVSLIAAAAVAMSLAGCDNKPKDTASDSAAQPASAPQPTSAPQASAGSGSSAAAGLTIDKFLMHHGGDFSPGHEIGFRVEGTPGAKVTYEIPGVQPATPMKESQPGVYEAKYAIQSAVKADGFFSATATLEKDGKRASAGVGTGAGAPAAPASAQK